MWLENKNIVERLLNGQVRKVQEKEFRELTDAKPEEEY